jgi:hypothetical protein
MEISMGDKLGPNEILVWALTIRGHLTIHGYIRHDVGASGVRRQRHSSGRRRL